MSKSDTINNWYEKMPKEFAKLPKKDPTYKDHLIKPCSMILSVGQTGSGKTNSVIEFLSRKNKRFYDITIYTGSTKDEPLYNFLQSRIDGLKLIDNPAELPRIDQYKDDDKKDLEKLIIFDDSVMEDKKVLKEIQKFYMMARKIGFTCLFLAQDYHSVPQFIRRNIQYLMMFKVTDTRDMKTILSKHAMDVDYDTLKNMLHYATKDKMDFLTIALNESPETKYRQNFTGILNPQQFQ